MVRETACASPITVSILRRTSYNYLSNTHHQISAFPFFEQNNHLSTKRADSGFVPHPASIMSIVVSKWWDACIFPCYY